MPFASVNGTELFYLDEGTGDPLVIVPGLGGPHRMFDPQAVAFRTSHRVVRPDLRGNGRSGPLDGPIATVLDRQCDDLAALLDTLGIQKAVLIGVSYGGALALRFALRHPDRLSGLVVSDAFASLGFRRPMEALLLLGSYLTLPAFDLPRPVLKWLGDRFARRWPEARAAVPDLVDSLRPREAKLQSIAMCRVDAASRLDRIACPTLGIVGGLSGTAIALMRRAVGPIPGARLDVVPGAFDPTNLCAPDAFNRLVSGFLDEIGDR
jgi:3-oxoadipate enol-lactonase